MTVSNSTEGFAPLVALDDVLEQVIDHRGKTPKKLGSSWRSTGVPALSAGNIKQGRVVNEEGIRFVDEETYRRWMPIELRPGDVILTSEAPLGEVLYWSSQRPYCLSQRLFALRARSDRLVGRYLAYTLESPGGQHELARRATGTTVLGIRQSQLRQVRVPLPTLVVQRGIAEVLGALDDKIDLNRRINSTLQSLADAHFRARFEPTSLTSELSEVAAVLMGQSPPGTTYNADGDGLPFYQGSSDFTDRFPKLRIFCTAATRTAAYGDVLLSVRAPVGDLNIADRDCAIGRGVACLRSKTQSRSYLYYLMRATRSGWARYEGEGTVFGSVNRSGVETFRIPRHESHAVSQFEAWCRPLDDLYESNVRQNDALAELRALLLPKLISGEIRVREATDAIDSAG